MSPRCVLSVVRASLRASACEPAVLRSSLLAASSSSHRLLGGFQPALQLGQTAADGLLQHAVGIVLFLETSPGAFELGLDLRDLDPALIGLDQLARSLVPCLLERHLDPAKLDGELSAKLILVGLYVRRPTLGWSSRSADW